ncbi:hypothetical protein [Rhizobium sp.]|uniref:hypothetical protein n=1 Tax=Rhizobium sp. TaxID=391 RepID=UPI0034C6C946
MLYTVSNANELNTCVAQVLNPSPTKLFNVLVQGNKQQYTYGDHFEIRASGNFYNGAAFAEFDRMVRDIYANMAVPMIIRFESIQSHADNDWPASILMFPDLMVKQGITKFWNVYVNVFDTSAANIRTMSNKQVFAMIDAGDLQTGVILRDTWFRWDLTLREIEVELGY